MKKLIKYFKESHKELKKVVWPSREAVVSSTKVVLVSTVIVAVFLGLVDFILLKGILFIF
ncbi:MAG: preprotein translocase subunit SecE [Sphaerochaeta sp.]|nr:preprotein translocase subunit SecE [Sphaerochaeta sp.]